MLTCTITYCMSFDVCQEVQELQEKYKTQAKEVREANQQRKLAVDDFSDINDKSVHHARLLAVPKRHQFLRLLKPNIMMCANIFAVL